MIVENDWIVAVERKSGSSMTGIKGIDFHKASGRWRARIQVGKKGIYLGLFPTAEAAAAAYQEAAKRLLGEFAKW